MTDTSDRIERFGTLIRHDGGFALRSDGGGLFHLQLHRVPVDHVEKRVRVTGYLIEDGLIEAEGVAPA